MPAIDVILSARLFREFSLCHPFLQEILCELAELWPNDKQMWFTCIFRPPAEHIRGESGIHNVGPPYRAADIRIRNLAETSGAFWEKARALADELNRRWIYDPRRPLYKVAVAREHGTGPHLHFQVHLKTRRRQEGDPK